VFSAGKIYQGSVVSIEKDETDQTISVSIYRPNSNGCEKTIFATYSIEGGAPNVDSLFFMNQRGKPNIFTIVHWDVNSRGIGTYGKYHQVYAYTKDEQGRLIENKRGGRQQRNDGNGRVSRGRREYLPVQDRRRREILFQVRSGELQVGVHLGEGAAWRVNPANQRGRAGEV
jgi:hypothetical protein